MDVICIGKSRRLVGEIKISGAKNAVLPVMAAALLTDKEIYLEGSPRLKDVEAMAGVLEHYGCRVDDFGGAYRIISGQGVRGRPDRSDELRASFLVFGPLLAKQGEAEATMPGGCNIGARPVDLHIAGLRAMGAEIYIEGSRVIGRARRLKGAKVLLPTPSVGATENIMMAACLADGITSIHNAATEPEICDLAKALRLMGAKIVGDGTKTVRIEGVEKLGGCRHTPVSDRIEAGTYMIAVAAAGGDVLVKGIKPQLLQPLIMKLRQAGVNITEYPFSVRLRSSGVVRPINVITMPYPGFPTDLQPQISALCLKAQGVSVIEETVFEKRFRHTPEFIKLGGRINIEKRRAVIEGVKTLRGCRVEATDLRAGAALVIAGLMAEGETEVGGFSHIERGYEDIAGQLRSIGANINEVEVDKLEEAAPARLEAALAR
ncbi:MAG: UDP-N-acetylglucosamine 1-carboxyvinyltransferase [Christensenellales bacterium]|jgi:UDP-N-acetylglucosamine 1-carboxyvinyltransferase